MIYKIFESFYFRPMLGSGPLNSISLLLLVDNWDICKTLGKTIQQIGFVKSEWIF